MKQGLTGLTIRDTHPGYEPSVSLTASAIEQWAEALPIANLGESASSSYRLLVDMNRCQLPGEKRVQLLSLVQNITVQVCELLQKQFLTNRIALGDKQRKIAALVQAIQTEMALGFQSAIEEITSRDVGWRGKKVLATAIAHAMFYHATVILRCYQLYASVPPRLWKEIYTLYTLAKAYEVNNTKLKLPGEETPTAIETLFARTLLLATAQPYQLRQNDINLMWKELASIAPHTQLKSHAFDEHYFLVDLRSNKPPLPKAHFKQEKHPAVLRLLVGKGLEQVKSLLSRLNNSGATGLSYKILYRHLINCWSEAKQRGFARTPGNETLEVCIGLGATHYQLSLLSQIPDDDEASNTLDAIEVSLRHATLEEVAKRREDEFGHSRDYLSTSRVPDADIWAKLYRPQQVESSTHYPEHQRTKDHITHESYRLQQCDLINMSPGGYCLQINANELPRHAQTGEIIGILEQGNNATSSWMVGVIRWIRRKPKTELVQMGVQLLAPNVYPVGIKRQKRKSDDTEYHRALLLPELSGVGQPATLITNPLSFADNDKAKIFDHGREYEVRLLKEVSASSSYRQFSFEKLSQREESSKAYQHPLTNAKQEDDNDNLWDLI